MANRTFYDVQCLNPGAKIIAGSFSPNGASAIDATTVKGQGFTVAYTSTGKYTVTLDDTYNDVISLTVTLAQETSGDQIVSIGAVDVSSAGTIEIFAWDISGAALADIAAASGSNIHFCFVLNNGGILS